MFSRRTNWKLTHNALTDAIAKARASGQDVIDLTISNPTQAGISPDSERVLAAFANPEAMQYDPQPRGLLSPRSAVAQYYRETQEIFDLDADRIFLTTSTSEAYTYIFRLMCDPGDEILIPKPSYPLFEFLADLADVKSVAYPLVYDHGWQIDFDSLYKAATPRTRAVITVHPNNPTGSYAHTDEMKALSKFCREYRAALVADEVFLDYAHDGASRPSFISTTEALTFTLSGISKISALPQMKLAWLAVSGPEGQVQSALSRLEIIADTYLSLNTPVQLAASVLLQQRKAVQPVLLDRLRVNLSAIDRQIAYHPAVTRLYTEGGWTAIIRVPALKNDEELAIDLLRKTGVIVHPGHFYDFATDGYLVLSLIADPAEFREGIARMFEVVGN